MATHKITFRNFDKGITFGYRKGNVISRSFKGLQEKLK